jgi:hypothetical protein
MSHDPYTILGLTPGRYDAAELRRRLDDRRAELGARAKTREGADELHVAYAVLREPDNQTVYLKRFDRRSSPDGAAELRALIAASLEDGLLRHSRRMRILKEGRRLGISPFHTQLLIAQTQFGPQRVLPDELGDGKKQPAADASVARWAGLFVLALALFLAAVRSIGV